MDPDQIQQITQWLNQQILHLNLSIIEAHKTKNCGRENEYAGMRDAFMSCLNKLEPAA